MPWYPICIYTPYMIYDIFERGDQSQAGLQTGPGVMAGVGVGVGVALSARASRSLSLVSPGIHGYLHSNHINIE
jgi:hypothetical protein